MHLLVGGERFYEASQRVTLTANITNAIRPPRGTCLRRMPRIRRAPMKTSLGPDRVKIPSVFQTHKPSHLDPNGAHRILGSQASVGRTGALYKLKMHRKEAVAQTQKAEYGGLACKCVMYVFLVTVPCVPRYHCHKIQIQIHIQAIPKPDPYSFHAARK